MNFQFSRDDEAFRDEVRAFARERLPASIALDVKRWHDPLMKNFRAWQRILSEKGWGAPHWPKQHGGSDWSPMRKHIFMQEMYAAGAPDFGWQGLHMLAPVLIAFGSKAQQDRFLPPMLNGDEVWCQGFSEPGAGSDLAHLKTAAVLDGDSYLINGQKIWTSDARDSDWGFFLCRTDPTVKPQRGLSFLLVPLSSAGLTIRPIRELNGRTDLNEVFLDNVRVPREHLVGEPGMGWTYAKYLLEKERTTSAFVYFNRRELEKTKAIARQIRVGTGRLLDTAEFALKLARVEADLMALEWSVLRILAGEKNKYNLDAVVSALKIRGSEMQQRVTDLQLDALGPLGVRHFQHGDPDLDDPARAPSWPDYAIGPAALFLHTRAATIYGGAREVQKNIIAKLAFGV
ncbi:MAG TPA: acyl-CoA dehydrogenase family protein [Steroidobacteraceae bacterium]|nr:acyl-CoA dehydrogenase family protein [Steroidobacteraceae bacterium]